MLYSILWTLVLVLSIVTLVLDAVASPFVGFIFAVTGIKKKEPGLFEVIFPKLLLVVIIMANPWYNVFVHGYELIF